MANFGGVFASGVLASFVEVGAEAARAVVGDEGAEGAAEVLEEIMAGGLELGGDFVSDFNLTNEGEVVAITLIGNVDFGAVFETFEEFVFPDIFVEDRVVDEVIVMATTGAEAGGGGEGIKLGGD